MARKRRPVDLTLAERLFSDRLKRLRNEKPPEINPALDALMGGTIAPGSLLEADEGAAPEGPPPIRRMVAASSERVRPRRYTVYLSAQDLVNTDYIASVWRDRRGTRGVSRSEVIRQAIRELRASLDTSSSPP